MLSQKVEKLAEEFIELLKQRAYDVSGASNEAEGDYGDWSDWKDALIEFYLRVKDDSSKDVQS